MPWVSCLTCHSHTIRWAGLLAAIPVPWHQGPLAVADKSRARHWELEAWNGKTLVWWSLEPSSHKGNALVRRPSLPSPCCPGPWSRLASCSWHSSIFPWSPLCDLRCQSLFLLLLIQRTSANRWAEGAWNILCLTVWSGRAWQSSLCPRVMRRAARTGPSV